MRRIIFLLIIFALGYSATVFTNAQTYYNCKSIAYLGLTESSGTLNYSVFLKDPDGNLSVLGRNFTTNICLKKEFEEGALPGNWSAILEDNVWRISAYANFTVRASPSQQTVQLLSSNYVIPINTYTAYISFKSFSYATCKLKIYRNTGVNEYAVEFNISPSEIKSWRMQNLVGTLNYPKKVEVNCNASIIATKVETDGPAVMLNPSQLSNIYYGQTAANGYVLISSLNSSVRYTVYSLRPDGSIRATYTGTINSHGTAKVSFAASSSYGLILIANDTVAPVFTPDGSQSLLYPRDSLILQGFAPFGDKAGTIIGLFSPISDAKVTLILRPADYGKCKQVGSNYYVCNYVECIADYSIPKNNTISVAYNSILTGCGLASVFPTSPTGSLEIRSTAPLAVSASPWSSIGDLSPVYKYGSQFTHNFFLVENTTSTSMTYLIFSRYDDTEIFVNGNSIGNFSKFALYQGSIITPFLNVSSNKPISISIKYSLSGSSGGGSIVIASQD
ncbi:MAG: hypothetical protein QW097_02145 [archaeon]